MDLRAKFVDLLPKQAIRLFAGPYVAGDSMEAALHKARELAHLGVASTIDVLGEDAASDQDIADYVSLYTRLVDTIADDARFTPLPAGLRPSISLKPSSFVIAPKDDTGMVIRPEAIDRQVCAHAIGQAVARAAARDVRATIDMENHQWTDLTLAIYRELFAQYGPIVGTVVQSRLLRTDRDIEHLPDGCRIRLCIGIYNEPAHVALQSIPEMKARMIPQARRLFEKNVFVEFATHDLPLMERFVREVVFPMQVPPDRFETQTLLGVPRQRLVRDLISGVYFRSLDGAPAARAALERGIVHRFYVPFAENWDKAIAYSRRRLRHSPSIFWTGLINAPRVLYYAMLGK
ncbi:MAG TPA: proline dehydrogenase family protein [Acidobacteriota bacterium]|nr:proline dehydrogenase family protein [Acidobacteriota bacterium]